MLIFFKVSKQHSKLAAHSMLLLCACYLKLGLQEGVEMQLPALVLSVKQLKSLKTRVLSCHCPNIIICCVGLSICNSIKLGLTFPSATFPWGVDINMRLTSIPVGQTEECSGPCCFVFWRTDRRERKRDLAWPVRAPVWHLRHERGVTVCPQRSEKGTIENSVCMIWITMYAACLAGPW